MKPLRHLIQLTTLLCLLALAGQALSVDLSVTTDMVKAKLNEVEGSGELDEAAGTVVASNIAGAGAWRLVAIK